MTAPAPVDWSSAPDARRHRLEARWTLPRALLAHVRAEARREGVTPSELVERALVAQLGEPPPLQEERPGKEERPSSDEQT